MEGDYLYLVHVSSQAIQTEPKRYTGIEIFGKIAEILNKKNSLLDQLDGFEIWDDIVSKRSAAFFTHYFIFGEVNPGFWPTSHFHQIDRDKILLHSQLDDVSMPTPSRFVRSAGFLLRKSNRSSWEKLVQLSANLLKIKFIIFYDLNYNRSRE